ncbi:MAG: CopG family transcriptional regulator [Spirochaetae bacterium HGW-Spirochaetae-6]|nr:MAG: CopG family transcriptional regulator [Spirochaetae bacterium HGW-Spirochaetae-6]
MVSIRLPEELEKKLIEIAKVDKKTKTEIIKLALTKFINDFEKNTTPFELGKDLFGKYGSNKGNLSKDRKKILKEKLRDKYTH